MRLHFQGTYLTWQSTCHDWVLKLQYICHLRIYCIVKKIWTLHFAWATEMNLDYVAHFYGCMWPNNRLVMTEFWKFNSYAIWPHIIIFNSDMYIDLSKPGHEITFSCYFCDLTIDWSWLSFETSIHMPFEIVNLYMYSHRRFMSGVIIDISSDGHRHFKWHQLYCGSIDCKLIFCWYK